MERRKQAFGRLELFFMAGVTVTSAILFREVPARAAIALAVVALLLLLLHRHFLRTLDRLKLTEVTLTANSFVRDGSSGRVSFSLSDISKVRIKKTTAGTVREIRITLRNGRLIFVAGLEQSGDFCRNLLAALDPEVHLTEFREPVDFDHPRFYRVLGLSLGVFSVLYIRFLVSADAAMFRCAEGGMLTSILVFGVYWLIKRPFSQYGVGKLAADILFGTFLVTTAVIVFIFDFMFV